MARPLRIEYPGAFYHVTSRGNEQKDVFRNKRDREKFLEYLASASERYAAVIHAYCLMNNHYHLLLETPDGNLSRIMMHINGAYTTYFNVKRKRAGHLFQGRYKAILVDADDYLSELSCYIHLNPVRAGIVERPEQYQWSSYRNYTGSAAPAWLQTGFILGNFAQNQDEANEKYRNFIEDCLGKEYESPLLGTIGAAILGDRKFIEKISSTHLRRKDDDDIPALRRLARRPAPEKIISAANAAIDDAKLARRVAMYLSHKHSGMKLKEIGELFDVRDTGVSEASRRFQKELDADGKLMEITTLVMKTANKM